MVREDTVRILCMEDDAVMAKLYRKRLTTAGYHVDLVHDGAQGLARLNSGMYDVVIVDHLMPEKTGLEVIQSLAIRGTFPPTIMITAAGDETLAVEAMKLGICDYLIKDAGLHFLAQLPSTIERALQKHFLTEENRRVTEAIKKAHDELEIRVQERTRELVTANLRLRQEIEERKKAEERIHRQHQFLRTVLESLTHPLCVIDANTHEILLANSVAKAKGIEGRTTCYTLTNSQAQPLGPSGFRCPVDELKRTGRPVTVEQVHSFPDRNSRVVEIHAYPIFDRFGEVVQAIEYCIDITNRKKVENGLIRSEAMLRRLIESAPIGIMIVKQGTYSYVNEAMVKMFGYDSRNEIDGRRLESLYAAEYRDLFRNGYLATESEDAECHVQEVRAIRRNGESFCASIWLRSIEFEGDPALLGFLVDVSEEQTLRSQLLLAQKMEALGTLAGGIAHDFNNILFAIMGYTELSMELVPKGTKLHEDLKAVLDAANRAKELVGQILTISRQRSESKKVPLKIGPIVKEIMKFLKASLPATIAMRHDITGEPAAIVGSATQIHQMLMNLCTNAAHAMQETGGELSVKVDHILVDAKDLSRYPDMSPGRYLRITVTDNGHGMAPDILQQIFEPYFTTKGPVEGTGLGLAVVREIVKTHGGVISVESEPARGTTFEVIFPLIEEQSVREEMDTPRVLVEPGTERILVVDDDKALTSMTGQILARLGYQVTTRTSSTDALELFRSMPSHFDLVMTDLIMPKMTGSDLTKAIMRIRPDIPVIICTGHMDLMTPEQADALGIAAILMKPLLKKELAQTIRRVLDRHRGASQNSASKGDNNCPGPLEAPQ